MTYNRVANVFEKILLPIAFIVAIAGFIMISSTKTSEGFLKLIAVFIWLILIFLMVVAAANEDMKEELAIIIKEQSEEIKSLRELNRELVEETKLLRLHLSSPKKK